MSILCVVIEPSEPTIFDVKSFHEPRKINMKIQCNYPEGDHFVCHCGRSFRSQTNYKEHFCWSTSDTAEEDTTSVGESSALFSGVEEKNSSGSNSPGSRSPVSNLTSPSVASPEALSP